MKMTHRYVLARQGENNKSTNGIKMRKFIFIASFLGFSGLVMAITPTPSLLLTNSTTDNSTINITLKVENATNINNIKFNGLNNFPVVGREVSFSSSTTAANTNQFQTKFYLEPLKAESATVYVTANVDGKNMSSNKIVLNVTKAQIDNYKKKQQQQAALENKRMKDLNEQIMQQMQEQQKFFDNINKLMQKQQNEMLKQQQELLKNLQ